MTTKDFFAKFGKNHAIQFGHVTPKPTVGAPVRDADGAIIGHVTDVFQDEVFVTLNPGVELDLSSPSVSVSSTGPMP